MVLTRRYAPRPVAVSPRAAHSSAVYGPTSTHSPTGSAAREAVAAGGGDDAVVVEVHARQRGGEELHVEVLADRGRESARRIEDVQRELPALAGWVG